MMAVSYGTIRMEGAQSTQNEQPDYESGKISMRKWQLSGDHVAEKLAGQVKKGTSQFTDLTAQN